MAPTGGAGGGLGCTDRKLSVLSAPRVPPPPFPPPLAGEGYGRDGGGLRCPLPASGGGLGWGLRHPAAVPHSIGRPGWTLRDSSGVNWLASAGIATSAISSGVQ